MKTVGDDVVMASLEEASDGNVKEIECSEIRKIFQTKDGPFEAVGSASFTVSKGEFVSLLGPSGCGKSTLLMLIGGLESVSSGSLYVAGHLVTKPSVEYGIMFQDPMLLPWKSALDNVLFPIKMMRKPRADYRDRAKELLQLVGLSEAEVGRRPKELSGGMKQRVAICRALIHNPRLLLMDEPFSALDAITRDEMNALLLEIWQGYKKTALFVTHSIPEAVLLSDRVLVMSRNPSRIVADVDVPFPRPRKFEILKEPSFNDLCNALRVKIGDGRHV